MMRACALMCILCTLPLTIYLSPDGECICIETDHADYPCTPETMQDSGCWDEDGHTQLCGARWVEVDP